MNRTSLAIGPMGSELTWSTLIESTPPSSRAPAASNRTADPASGPAPVFIVGAERSGTTMFRLMLAAHPRIAVCSAFEYIVDLLEDAPPSALASTSWPEPSRAADALRGNWIFQSHGFTIDPAHDFPQMADAFRRQTLERKKGATHFIALVHRHIHRLLQIWPHARFIHMVRDPRDVAKSVIGMGWAGNTWHGIRYWIPVERDCERLRDQLPADRWMDIRYEDLVASPRAELERACSFLGVEFDSRLLEFHHGTTYDAPDVRFTEQWKRKQSRRDVQLVEMRIGSMLSEHGYEASGYPPHSPSAVERFALAVQNKFERLRFRIARYGLGLFLAESLSRRFGMKRWHERTNARMHEIWKQHLK